MRHLLCLAAALSFTGCLQTQGEMAQGSFEPAHSLQGVKTLKVSGISGDMRVSTHEESTLRGKVSFRSFGEGQKQADQRAEGVELQMEENGAELSVYLSGTFHRSNWDLLVPAGLDLRLSNSNGEVTLTGGFGSVQAETSNGRITAQGSLSQFDLCTSNGDVVLNLGDGLSASSRVSTSNGDVLVSCKGCLNCTAETSTSNGTTEQTLLSNESREHILEIDTSNGDIEITEAASDQ